MKIFVCIKQVPDTETKIKIAADGKSADTAGVKWILCPYDEFAVEEAIRFKEKNAGATVHLVTAELDHGPILQQAVVPVLPTDDADTLAARVLTQEHLIYPQALRDLLSK